MIDPDFAAQWNVSSTPVECVASRQSRDNGDGFSYAPEE